MHTNCVQQNTSYKEEAMVFAPVSTFVDQSLTLLTCPCSTTQMTHEHYLNQWRGGGGGVKKRQTTIQSSGTGNDGGALGNPIVVDVHLNPRNTTQETFDGSGAGRSRFVEMAGEEVTK